VRFLPASKIQDRVVLYIFILSELKRCLFCTDVKFGLSP
jgi:hypothetical protein